MPFDEDHVDADLRDLDRPTDRRRRAGGSGGTRRRGRRGRFAVDGCWSSWSRRRVVVAAAVELAARRSSWARAVKMPVPQSWYATNSRISSPTVTSIRPTPAIVRRTIGRLPMRAGALARGDGSLVTGAPSVDSRGTAPGPAEGALRCPSCHRLRSAVCLLDRFPALAGADLDVDAGEIVLLAGPNGAGKTTLLRLLRRPARRCGRARVACSATTSRATGARVRRSVGSSATRRSAYDDLTVAENVQFAARAAGRTRAAADAALERLGLAGSPRSRTAGCRTDSTAASSLAIALARDPRLLLLDEPHAGLDADGTRGARRGAGERRGRGPHRAPRVARARSGAAARAPRGARSSRAGPTKAAPRSPRSSPDDGQPQAQSPVRRVRPMPCVMEHIAALARGSLLVAGKDLRIERRSRVALQQIAAVRRDRPVALRVRPRSRPRVAAAGRARASSGSRCSSPRCSRSAARSRSRKRTGRATGCGSRASTARRSSSARPPPSSSSSSCSRSCSAIGVFVLYDVEVARLCCSSSPPPWPRPSDSPPPVPSTACSAGACGPGDARPAARVAGRHAGHARRYQAFEAALDGRPGTAWPWVQLLVGVRRRGRHDRRPGLRAAAGGIVTLKWLTGLTVVSLAVTVVLALAVAPADAVQGDA